MADIFFQGQSDKLRLKTFRSAANNSSSLGGEGRGGSKHHFILLTFNAPDVPRGRIIGINQSAMSLGNIIGPLVGGFVYDRNPAWPPRVSAAVLFVMWLLSLGLTQPAKPEGPAPASGAPAA